MYLFRLFYFIFFYSARIYLFVCFVSAASGLPSPPPTTSSCRSDYVSWYKNCYKLVSEPKPWEEAQAACVKEGGNLASVDMSYDQAFISAVLQQGKSDTWIGLRRKVRTHAGANLKNDSATISGHDESKVTKVHRCTSDFLLSVLANTPRLA